MAVVRIEWILPCVGHLPAGTYVVAGSSEQGVAHEVFVKE